MSELDLRCSPWNEGLAIPYSVLSIEIYRLLCMFHASPSIQTSKLDAHLDLRREHQESEIGRVLLFVAASIRNAIDQNPSRADYWLSLSPTDVVGVLTPDLKEIKKFEDLHFREACNKILHCDSINFDYRARKPKRGDVLNPRVHIYGTLRRQHWKATREIDRFTDIACSLNV
jgi:hypothetical protein